MAKLRAADAVDSPPSLCRPSEGLKAFLDRLRRTCLRGGQGQNRREAGRGRLRGWRPRRGGPACAATLERVLQTCGFDLRDVVPVRRQNLEMKLAVLTHTGKWLAAG